MRKIVFLSLALGAIAEANTVSFKNYGKVQSFLASVTLTAKMCEDKYKSHSYSGKSHGYCFINICDKNTPFHMTHRRIFHRFVYGSGDDEHVVRILGGRSGNRLDSCLIEVTYTSKIPLRGAWTDVKTYIEKAFNDLPNGKFEVPVIRIVP